MEILPKKERSVQKTTFYEAEMLYESGRVSCDRMKVSGKNAQIQKKLQQSMVKY